MAPKFPTTNLRRSFRKAHYSSSRGPRVRGNSSFWWSGGVVVGLGVAGFSIDDWHETYTSCTPPYVPPVANTAPVTASSSSPHKQLHSIPGVIVELTKDTIEHHVVNQKPVTGDVFLKVYADWCPSCALLAPVITQVGHSVQGTAITVVSMEEMQNKEGFLEADELEALPLLKLFKADGTIESYNGPGRSADIVAWLHQHATEKFDLEKALDISISRNEETELVLRAQMQKRLENPDEIGDEGFKEMLQGKCGTLVEDSFLKMKLAAYIGGKRRSEEFHEAIGKVGQCLKDIGHPSMKEAEKKAQQEEAAKEKKKEKKKEAKEKKKKKKKKKKEKKEKKEKKQGSGGQDTKH